MPKLNLELLGAPTPPYPHLRITLVLDVYGKFTKDSAVLFAQAAQIAVDEKLKALGG